MLSHMARLRPQKARFPDMFACSLAALALATPMPALAQDESPDQDEAQAIIITGSRLARSTFDAPSPVTVVGGEEFENRAVVNVGAGISDLPAFRPSTTPTTQGFGSFNVGAQIVNLRGIGVTRNLILVDGRRFAPTTREGSVDLNLVPAILVSRADVVTGGASAAYGSDALAGVVNIVLDKQLDGFKVQADYGISDEGDGDDLHLAGAFGTDFGANGHFVIGGEYDNQKGIGNCFTRDWCTAGTVVSNPGFAANGKPNFVRADTGAGWFFNTGGVVSSNNNTSPATAALRGMLGTGGITFAPDGSPRAFNVGSTAFALSQIGGDVYPTYTDANITVPVERYSIFAHADMDFNDSISGFLEGSFGHVDGTLLQTAYFTASIPIYADNAYIPAALRPFVPLPATTSPTRPAAAAFNMGRVLDDVGRGLSISTADTWRVTGGLSGTIGAGWSWDAYYQYGRTDRLQTVQNNLIVSGATPRFSYATDAVRDPATGNIVCRATLDPSATVRAAATGCVPVNLFGAGNVSQAGKNYIFGTLTEDINLQQHVVAANIRGDVADLWAGPLSVALGGEYRVDKIEVLHDPLSNQYAYFQNFGSDYRGTTKVTEGYVEAELPLVKDASWTKSLLLNGAVRLTHYDISGFGSYLRTSADSSFDATSWKASLVWDPISAIRLRATQSRDIRAPNFADLFLASASAFTPIVNRFNTAQSAPPTIVNGGSPSLRPEKADTTTIGIVLSPGGALDGLRLSVDWYKIKVKDYIGQVPGGVQFIVDRCFAGVQTACTAIDFGANQTITQIRNISLNLDYIQTKGIDIEAAYRIDLGGERQALTLRALATYVAELKTASFGDVVDRAGQTGNSAGLAAPDWTASSFLTYDSPHVSVTVQGRYIAGGLYDAQRIGPDNERYATSLPNSISDNQVQSRFYVNLFGTYRLSSEPGRGAEIFGAVNNLFDRAPPPAPETQFYTNPVYFDTIGRYFRFGVRYKY